MFLKNEAVRELDWPVIVGIGSMHILALLAFIYPSWSGFLLFMVLWYLSGWVGIAFGGHRLFTHRSFKIRRPFELITLLLFYLTWQGRLLTWVGNHRLHHKNADKEGDPHSPNHGFDWAHCVWLFFKAPERQDPLGVVGDLKRDNVVALLDPFFWVPQFLLTALILWLGWKWGGYKLALSWLGWAIGLRTVYVYHITWFVNSACHTWGKQPYNTGDRSTNLFWVGLLAGGEGWHNNHHKFQTSARHGFTWKQIDPTWMLICVLLKLRIITSVIIPTEDEMAQSTESESEKQL